MGDLSHYGKRRYRIVGHPRYPNTPGSLALVAEIVRQLRGMPGHVFWSDKISLLDREHVKAEEIATSQQVTDSYLLSLAGAHGGKLATFDRRLSVKSATIGSEGLLLIPAA